MIIRHSKDAILRLASQFPVVGIVGPRQSGKTTISKEMFPQKKYITFDDINMRKFAEDNPHEFLQAFPEGGIFDEVQKVPGIFDAIKMVVDGESHTPGRYILTGSSQFRLKQNMSDSLAGRAAYFNLLPFSLGELEEGNLINDSVYDIILKGQYPPLYDSQKNFIPEDWLDSYIDTCMDLDIKDEITPSNLSSFKTFVRLCAACSGKILSMDSISKKLAVSAPTVKKWLSILESAFIIFLLPVTSENYGKSLIKAPKLYFYDSGLLCHLLGIKDKSALILSEHKVPVVETFAISELIKCRFNKAKKHELSYFRDKKGFEIDIIAKWEKEYAIEIKSDISPNPKYSSALKKYLGLEGVENCSANVFYLGDMEISMDDINYVPWKNWNRIA